MAKKELTEEDIIKKQYSNLVNLNQRLKNISEGYYIAHDNTVYLKSLVPFIEKFIKLKDDIDYSYIKGSMIMPNAFFEFSKNAKKTKLISLRTENGLHFGQNDNEELQYDINILNSNELIDSEYVNAQIKPKMYKRFFELTSDKYHQLDRLNIELSEDDVFDLTKARPVYLNAKGSLITLTKQLFLDIKKDDKISIQRMCYQNIENQQYRVFYMIVQETNLYDCFTIFNTLQSTI